MSASHEYFTGLTIKAMAYANDSVDCHKQGRQGSKAETGEPYVTYCFFFYDEEDCMMFWRETIDGLVSSKKHEKHECSIINNSPKLSIYWRTYPEIKFYEEKKGFIFRARLLMTSKDMAKAMVGGV